MFGPAQGGGIVKAADQYGFIMVVPSSGRGWDVVSNKTRMRGGGGDSHAIKQMVSYALQTRGRSRRERLRLPRGAEARESFRHRSAEHWPRLFGARRASRPCAKKKQGSNVLGMQPSKITCRSKKRLPRESTFLDALVSCLVLQSAGK